MSVTNSQQISRYYDFFRDKEIVFTKANLRSLRIDPRQIYIKCNGGQWPCIINSSSLQMAKVILGTSSGAYTQLNAKKDQVISLRYCFMDQSNSPIHFFVNCNVGEVKEYNNSKDLALVTLNFTQRPPDDLIVRIGEFIEVNENFNTRKEERIAINSNSLREIGIAKEETVIFISNVPRKCVIKDLSFGGARVMLVGIPKFLQDKEIDLRLYFSNTEEKISLKGVVKNSDFLEGRKDIAIVNIEFCADEIPMTYKFHINSYIMSYQKKLIEKQLQNKVRTAQAEVVANQKAMEMKEKREAAAKQQVSQNTTANGNAQ